MSLPLKLRVHAIEQDGQDIKVFDLRSDDQSPLPPFFPGAHIDVAVGQTEIRQYSLINAPGDDRRFRFAVARQSDGKGGSLFLHDRAAVGDHLDVSAPKGHFRLEESAEPSILIAGGVGVTPIWSMVQHLEALGRRWDLHYAAKSPQAAAFLGPLEQLSAERRSYYYTATEGGVRPDLAAIVEAAPQGAHFYCCGPESLLAAFKAATQNVASARVHLEYFSNEASASAPRGGFRVKLARSNKIIDVPQGQSILQAMLANGVRVDYACREGVCGSCETRVLEGVPDHRDLLLTPAEQEAGKTMMVCCSGSKSELLILDR